MSGKKTVTEREPMDLPKHLWMLMAGFAFAVVLCAFVHLLGYYHELEQNEAYFFQLVGGAAKKDRLIANAGNVLKGVYNGQLSENGRSLLNEYGYDERFYGIRKKRFGREVRDTVFFSLLLYGIFLFCLYIMNLYQHRREDSIYREIGAEVEYLRNGTFIRRDLYQGRISKLIFYEKLMSLGDKIQLGEERQIREKEEIKALVTDISHQLKTPVASLNMCSDLLLDETLDEGERQEFQVRLKEEIMHLGRLTEALVNISRMECGMIEIHMEIALILPTVTAAVNAVWLKAQEKNISIELGGEETEGMEKLKIPHDVKWTTEALVNLLDNAVKYSPEGSLIQIQMFQLTTFLRIEISDEGLGVSKEEYNQIFKRFYRGKQAVKKESGSGVGLYLSRKIIEAQQGSVTVSARSGAKTCGSTFTVSLRLF